MVSRAKKPREDEKMVGFELGLFYPTWWRYVKVKDEADAKRKIKKALESGRLRHAKLYEYGKEQAVKTFDLKKI